MSTIVFFTKAHVRAYDRTTQHGVEHVGEYETKRPSARLTPQDIFAGLRAHAEGLRAAAEAATAPRDKPTVTHTATPPQQREQKKPALRLVPQQQPKEQQAPQAHQVKPPQSLVTALQRVQNGAKFNEVMIDFAKMPLAQQHLVDQWLVLTKHPLSNHPGSTAERFRLLVQGLHQRLKEHRAKREKPPPEVPTPAPAAVVAQHSQRREDEGKLLAEARKQKPKKVVITSQAGSKATEESSDTHPAVLNFEKEHRHSPHEQGLAVKNGKVMGHWQGTEDRIEFHKDDWGKFHGADIFTHVHPRDYSFSPQDVHLMIEDKIKQFRAVSPSATHVLTEPKGGWDTQGQTVSEFAQRVKDRYQDILPLEEEKLKGLPKAEMRYQLHHNVMAKLAREFGAHYERQEVAGARRRITPYVRELDSYPPGRSITILKKPGRQFVGNWTKTVEGKWKQTQADGTTRTAESRDLTEDIKRGLDEQPFTPERIGKTETVRTDQGAKIDVQYALVDANSLIASHDTAFKQNPDFPPELQPRDRSRAASETQIQGMLANFQPELLGANPKASDGAPIVGPDGAVEVGNGRTIALRRAYEGNLPQAAKYKSWLQEHAEDFGLPKGDIDRLKKPMLVRIRQTDVNRQEFVQETNKPSAAVYSPAEQAKNDARLLTPGLMQQFNPEPEAGVRAAENRSFVRGFLQGLTKEEVGSLTGSKGELSQAGALRIKNALLHRAYGNSDLVEKIAESTDDATRNVSNALVAAAPRIAALKADMEAGNAHPIDLTPDIAHAALKLSTLKAQGEKADSYLAQMDLMAPELSPESRDLLAAFDQHHKKPQNIRALLHSYVDFLDRAGNPKESGLFGKPVTPTKAEAVQYAIQQAEKGKGVLAASWGKLTGLIATILRKAHVRGYERTGPSGQEVKVSEYESTREKKLKPGDPHPLYPHLAPSTAEHRALAAQRGVKVPPMSWGLWVAPTADAKLQATWYDRSGKKQPGYHPDWIAASAERKFAAIQQTDAVIPEVERKIAEDLQREDAHPARVAAAVVSLIHKAFIRVGSEKYAQEHDTYGASSLRKHHVEVNDKGVTLRFVGKHGKAHEKTVDAPELKPVLQHLQSLPGDRLFQYRHKEEVLPLTEQHVRDYLAPHGITPKSFRTYHATRLAAEALSKLGRPKDEQEAKKNIAQVVKQVSEQLGNTPAVCRASYINPAVLDAYVKGSL